MSSVEHDKSQSSVWVWCDLEMTGLEPLEDEILEVSCILTTSDLREYTTTPFSEVVHQPDAVLHNMSEWCIEHHGNSGLTEACRQSKKPLSEIETQLISYIQEHTLPTDMLYLAGNSIHMDRAFIKQHMKGLDSLLHYRMIDVTSIGIMCEAMGISRYEKEAPHRALDDIRLSIAELKHYQSSLVVSNE